jgi:2-polyprenyl-3-methyl-5-hydroxy-6-metoxy-1,4-benzoquinol methylase
MVDVFREALLLLSDGGRRPGRLLDVGCAYGFFLEEARRQGWRAEGIDLSAGAIAHAESRGLDARVASLESAEFEAESFDAVTMFYVLEHLLDPRAALEKVHRWLRPGGVLLLRIPHTAPLVRCLDALGIRNELFDPPHHLGDFDPRGLRRVLEQSGFSGVRTFPGASTRPRSPWALACTKTTSLLASAIHRASGGRLLLPGVSKTTVAFKPLSE